LIVFSLSLYLELYPCDLPGLAHHLTGGHGLLRIRQQPDVRVRVPPSDPPPVGHVVELGVRVEELLRKRKRANDVHLAQRLFLVDQRDAPAGLRVAASDLPGLAVLQNAVEPVRADDEATGCSGSLGHFCLLVWSCKINDDQLEGATA